MISVIIPVYNKEATLASCVNSVLIQSYKEWEIILVDDGSTDDSLMICQGLAILDKRIHIIHQKNGGVSSARNRGLSCAHGEWIVFLDADDLLPQHALKDLSANYEYDLVIGGFIDQTKKSHSLTSLSDEVIIKDSLGDFLSNNIDKILLRVPWAKLYKKEIIDNNNLRFCEKLYFGEDAAFVANYLLYCNKIRVMSSICYIYYNIGEDYILKYRNRLDSVYYLADVMNKRYEALEDAYGLTGARSVYGFIFDIVKKEFNHNSWTHIEQFRNFLLQPRAKLKLKERNSIHIRLLLILAQFSSINLLLFYLKAINFIKSVIKKPCLQSQL